MKRKGGQQQRIKAARAQEESSAAGITQQSALVTFLLTLFTWGEFSPQRCQHIAALALEDLEKHHTNKHIVSDLKALASIGSNGAYPNKMHQDLMQRTKNISKVPQPYLFNAKFKSPVGVQNQSLLLPHELFATIAAEYQTTWFKSICPDQSNLETFWETAVNHPLLHDHPVLHREHWRRYAVPIALHGDGVPVVGIGKAWTKLLNVFSWFSLVGTGTTRSKLFYTYSCWDKICEGSFPDGSLGSAFRVLQWSFYWLWLGQWPDRDHKGKVLPEFIAIFV